MWDTSPMICLPAATGLKKKSISKSNKLHQLQKCEASFFFFFVTNTAAAAIAAAAAVAAAAAAGKLIKLQNL